MPTLNPSVSEGAYTTTLEDLRNRVLIRTGYGAQLSNPPPGVAALINDFLSSAQTLLAEQFPDLVTERFYQWTMVAGTRFYSTSGDDEGATSPDFILDPRKITWVGIEDLNGQFYPLHEGIPPEHYTTVDNLARPARYEIRQSLEVSPSPDAAYKLTVKGRPKNFAFTADTDVCTIDPELIFLLALGNAKAHYRQPDANVVFTQANTYLGRLTAGTHGTARYIPKTQTLNPEVRPTLETFIEP